MQNDIGPWSYAREAPHQPAPRSKTTAAPVKSTQRSSPGVSMLSGRAAIVSVVLVIATLGLYCVFRPHSSPNEALVEPRLRALQEPFRVVKSYYYFDGGSVGITIEDAKGAKE